MEYSFLSEISDIISNYPSIKLGYFFGSRARGQEGPLSDYDFAFYSDEPDAAKQLDLRLELMGKISQLLSTDKIDIVFLSLSTPPELAYAIIKEGILFCEKELFRISVEPQIMNRYFDFSHSLKHNFKAPA